MFLREQPSQKTSHQTVQTVIDISYPEALTPLRLKTGHWADHWGTKYNFENVNGIPLNQQRNGTHQQIQRDNRERWYI